MQLMKEAVNLIIQLPLGLIVAAITERTCRRYTKWFNIGIKSAIAFVLVRWAVVGGGGDNNIYYNTDVAKGDEDAIIYYHYYPIILVLRILLLFTGIVVGTASQPVGLTGGIATGKSTVSHLLSLQETTTATKEEQQQPGSSTDFIIIDVDGIAHDILLPNKLGRDSVYHLLVAQFGTGILEDTKDEDSRCSNNMIPLIDRRKLGDIVFQDRQKRKILNSITHPKIIKLMLQRILWEGLNPSKRQVVCVDIPLLFEGGLPMKMLFGTIVVVTCSPDVQLKRLHKRNSDLTLEQCRQRIASQIPVEEKAREAHVVIRNDGDFNELKNEVARVKDKLASIVIGSQRGVELSWLVMGYAAFYCLCCHFGWTFSFFLQ